jgi:hypothetical protein
MGSFREQMDEARAILHDEMSVEAVYFVPPYNPLTTVVQDITVRVHDKFIALGDLKGTNFNYAELESIAPRIVFWREQIEAPEHNAIVSLKPGLAYRIDRDQEYDGVTVTAYAARMDESKTSGFPVPPGTV